MAHELPPLTYGYADLEPWYDEQTLRLHHDKHHQGYVNGLNGAEAALAAAREAGDFGAVKDATAALAFHGPGHMLHSTFWTNMKPQGGGAPEGALLEQLVTAFGSYEGFLGQMKKATATVEGSGWGLLVWNRTFGKLEVLQAHNHQHTAHWASVPVLAVDVWEHAYYLKYQNRRAAFIDVFFGHLVDWDDVAARLEGARS